MAKKTEKQPEPAGDEPKKDSSILPPPYRFGLGHIPDLLDERDHTVRAKLGAPRNLPNEALGLEGYLRDVMNQGGSSSCVGQAIGTAVDTRMRRIGLACPPPSRVGIYTFGRSLGRLGKTALRDEGCYPRDAMRGIRDNGVPLEKDWPFDEAGINDEVPWDVHQSASALRLTGWSRIDSQGQSRIDELCHTLALGYPVVFGAAVDERFMEHTGKGEIAAVGKDTRGNHMMCALGYTTVNGHRLFRAVNSWGTGWGDGGLYWAGESFFRDPRTSDYYAMEVGG